MNGFTILLSMILIYPALWFTVNLYARFFSFQLEEIFFENPKKESLWAFLGIGIGELIAIAITLLVYGVGVSENQHSDVFSQSPVDVSWRALISAMLAVPSIFILWRRKDTLNSLGITSFNLVKSLALVTICVIVSALIITELISERQLDMLLQWRESYIWNFLFLLIIAIPEEFLFRGYLMPRLVSWVGEMPGLLITSVLYIFFHSPLTFISYACYSFEYAIMGMLLFMPISLFLGYLRLRTGNLISIIIFNALEKFLFVLL